MAATYILVGGNERSQPTFGQELTQVLTAISPGRRLLSCRFSWPEEKHQAVSGIWDEWFRTQLPAYEMTVAREDLFLQQLTDCDIVYFHGGQTQRLLETMASFSDIKRFLTGKVVIGSSAGANYLSSYCLTHLNGPLAVRTGGGLLDLAVAVHYRVPSFEQYLHSPEEWDAATERLQASAPNGSVIALFEGRMSVIVE